MSCVPSASRVSFTRHAEGSVLVEFGDTRVLCTASVEETVPSFLRNSGKGWITAEYGMLPRATHTRRKREAASGKQGGRTLEIQRLIGRALRAVIDLTALGERSDHASIATCSRPTAARALPRSPAATSPSSMQLDTLVRRKGSARKPGSRAGCGGIRRHLVGHRPSSTSTTLKTPTLRPT